MTFSDFYDVVVFLAILGLPVVALGWSIDRWPEWCARHEAFELEARLRWHRRDPAIWVAPGTVQRPSDPSPRPRNTPPIQSLPH